MLDIVKKLKESPNITQYSEYEDSHGKTTAIDLNPTYFFTVMSVIENQKQKHCYLLFNTDKSNSYDEREVHEYQVVHPFLLDVDLCPVMYNSKHNRLELREQFFVESTYPSCRFINHASITQHKDGLTSINLKEKEVYYVLECDMLCERETKDITLVYDEKSDCVEFIDNQVDGMPLDGIINNFTDLVFNSRLTDLSSEYYDDHKAYIMIRNYISQYLTGVENILLNLDGYKIHNNLLFKNLCKARTIPNIKKMPWDMGKIIDLLAETYDDRNRTCNSWSTEIPKPSTLVFCPETKNNNRIDYKLDSKTATKNMIEYLKIGDIENAKNALFYGNKYPEEISKLLSQISEPCDFAEEVYRDISLMVDLLGKEKTKQVLLARRYSDLIDAKNGKQYGNERINTSVINDGLYREMILLGFHEDVLKLSDKYGTIEQEQTKRAYKTALTYRAELNLEKDITIEVKPDDDFSSFYKRICDSYEENQSHSKSYLQDLPVANINY